MAALLFVLSRDFDNVVTCSSSYITFHMLLRPALIKLTLFAGRVVGSAEPVPALPAAQNNIESNSTRQSHSRGLEDLHQKQVTCLRIWQVCLALHTVLHCASCLVFWLFMGQYCM
ncbi:TPA: hypothetical protein ACH3X1_008926 [Trebouxia sp. C0004]